MEGDSIKDWKELPVEEVDFENGSWSFGRGGYPLKDSQWVVEHVNRDLISTRYVLPDCINHMLRRQFKHGQQDIQSSIRNALDL